MVAQTMVCEPEEVLIIHTNVKEIKKEKEWKAVINVCVNSSFEVPDGLNVFVFANSVCLPYLKLHYTFVYVRPQACGVSSVA
jgi:hypothetical protein